MLQPDHQVVLTEALRPPVGFRMDHAITTTYSLDLTASLIAPLSFAAASSQNVLKDLTNRPVELLDAVQRYIDRTTVFVQAGGIHVPGSHSRILAFLEDSVVEVQPPSINGIFHPKLWAVRYIDTNNGHHHHRLIISSRNLTLDTSWDTILVLDESFDGSIDAQPAAEFIAALPDLALRELPQQRQQAIRELSKSLAQIRFQSPPNYNHGELLPLGLKPRTWNFPARADAAIIISPFLNATLLDQARAGDDMPMLISRPEALDELGKTRLANWDTHVLHASLHESGDDDPEAAIHQNSTTLAGLHAKTAVYDLADDESMTVTGSANFTRAAWQDNIEFNAVLYGPTKTTGTAALLGTEAEVGLAPLLEAYAPAELDPQFVTEQRIQREIETFHRELARSKPVLSLLRTKHETVAVDLRVIVPDHKFTSKTRVWLTTVPQETRTLADQRSWEVAPVNVTAFLAVETTVDGVTRRCILTCELIGDEIDRRRVALASMLGTPEKVLQYIALLLDPTATVSFQPILESREYASRMGVKTTENQANTFTAPILFEPLMQATRDPKQLQTLARQIDELRSLPAASELLTEEFFNMWDTVQLAVDAGETL